MYILALHCPSFPGKVIIDILPFSQGETEADIGSLPWTQGTSANDCFWVSLGANWEWEGKFYENLVLALGLGDWQDSMLGHVGHIGKRSMWGHLART